MISSWIRWIPLVLLLVLGVQEVRGTELPPPPPARKQFKSYGIQQGLNNLAVTNLIQDAEGFLWVGTQGNLFRFDGQRFQSFGLKEGLHSGYITALASAPGQGVWAGTWNGLAHLEGAGFKPVLFPASEAFPRINAMAFDSFGKLWIASSTGAFVLEPGGKPTAVAGWPEREAHAVCPTSKGVWFSAGPKVLFRSPTGKWKQPAPMPSHEGEQILDLLVHPDGRVLARSTSHLWILHPGAKSFAPLNTHFALSTHGGSRCHLAPDGQIWIPTDEGLLSLQGDVLTHLGRLQGLPTGAPWAVMIDHEGSFWVGGQGIHRDLGNSAWGAYTTQEGLPHDEVWAILRDSRNRLWAGTSLGLALETPQGWRPVPATRQAAIRSLIEGPEGTLWAGTAKGEVLILDITGRIRQRLGPESGLRTREVLSLCRSAEGVWVGTDGDGLFRLSRESGTWKAIQETLGSWGPERVSHVISDSTGRLWVATEHGIAIREHGSWRHFDRSHGLRQNHVSYLNVSQDGELRVAYFEAIGISRFKVDRSGKPSLIAHWDSGNHLSSDTAHLLGEDSRGRFWVGGTRGADVFLGENRMHFGSHNGLVGENCIARAFLAEPNGQVWVGTSAGLAHYTGKGRVVPPVPPGVLLVSARLGSQTVELPCPEGFKVGRRENELSVQFAGTSFVHADNLEYTYRFSEGGRGPWKTTRGRDLHITALSPGDYTLQLRSRLEQGDWGPVTELRFSIQAAWWQWWWLRSLGIALLLGLLGRLVYWYFQNLRQRNTELEILLKLSDSLAQELESANLNLQEQTLTDPLTGLKNRRFLDVIIARDLAEVERMHREESPSGQNMDLLFLMVDIDHFKWVNDHHGHQAGDAILQQFGEVLKTATRGSDTVIRYGGEEFLILARQTRRDDAIVLAERIRKSVENRRFTTPSGEHVTRTCSIGFAPYPVCESNLKAVPWERVLELADQCLYQAKDEGRNQWMGLLPRYQTLKQAPASLPQDLESLLHMGILQLVSSNDSKAPEGAQVDR